MPEIETTATMRRRPIRDEIRDRVRLRLIAAVVGRGHTQTDAEEVVAGLEAERPLLDWLRDGGWVALLKFVLELLVMFAAATKTTSESLLRSVNHDWNAGGNSEGI